MNWFWDTLWRWFGDRHEDSYGDEENDWHQGTGQTPKDAQPKPDFAEGQAEKTRNAGKGRDQK